MGQMHISGRHICYFVIYTTNWISVQKIDYDTEFRENKMFQKLKRKLYEYIIIMNLFIIDIYKIKTLLVLTELTFISTYISYLQTMQ